MDRTVAGPVLAVAGFYAVLIGVKLVVSGSPAAFVVAGDVYVERGVAPLPAQYITAGSGYDGQFYFRMALAPLSREPVEHGIAFDIGAYRQQRILYPLLAYALSVGNSEAVPWVLILINFAAVTGVAYIASAILAEHWQSPWWSVLIACYPGLQFAVVRDLTDVVALFCILSALRSQLAGRRAETILYLSLAALTRESTLLVALAMALHRAQAWTAAGKSQWHRELPYAIPFAIYAAWSQYCAAMWAQSPLTPGYQPFGFPFRDLVEFVWTVLQAPSFHGVLWAVEAGLLVSWLALGAFALNRSPAPRIVKWSLVCYLPLLACMNMWNEDWGFLRIAAPAFALSMLVLAPHAKSSRWVQASAAGWGLVTVYQLIALST